MTGPGVSQALSLLSGFSTCSKGAATLVGAQLGLVWRAPRGAVQAALEARAVAAHRGWGKVHSTSQGLCFHMCTPQEA